ncbi:hypothetical protein FHR82_006679 [Actinophytocola algeriensis]|uniref:FAD-binding domain-containing protein n=1 Tax=Actinophytocola algeriensis TaxID=1768010 RepID=A0A7W7QC44_9PSEU|nr:hypothetical protein [Actinophytocola algeriensis]
MTSIQETTDTVVATLSDGELRARHVIAADGARSGIRNALGIGRNRRGAIGEPSVYFHADLADVVRGREFNLCLLDAGGLASVDGRTRWVLMVTGGDTDRDWPAVVRTALGVPAPDVEILSVLPWQAEMLVADGRSTLDLAGPGWAVLSDVDFLAAASGHCRGRTTSWRGAAPAIPNRCGKHCWVGGYPWWQPCQDSRPCHPQPPNNVSPSRQGSSSSTSRTG